MIIVAFIFTILAGIGSGYSIFYTYKNKHKSAAKFEITALPGIMCECGHKKNYHYGGKQSCFKGYCDCQIFTSVSVDPIQDLVNLL